MKSVPLQHILESMTGPPDILDLQCRTTALKELEMVYVETSFADGDRVRVSDHFFWARGATGAIAEPPAQVTAISGPWSGGLTRQENSALGTNTVYWVWFDEPQYDADGDGPYEGGAIWESALAKLFG